MAMLVYRGVRVYHHPKGSPAFLSKNGGWHADLQGAGFNLFLSVLLHKNWRSLTSPILTNSCIPFYTRSVTLKTKTGGFV